MFNAEQRAYMATLDNMDPATKCWCGWYALAECRCERVTNGQTCADKIAAKCPECGNDPFQPGSKIVHLRNCSHSS